MRSAIAIAVLVLSSCVSSPRLPRGVRVEAVEAPPPTTDEVREAQERLTTLGVYDGAVNGELGARTRVALARFQRITGMTPTGLLDARTMDALVQATTAPRAVSAGRSAAPGRPAPVQAPALPSAAKLLAEEGTVLQQPPAGALCGALSEAAAILEKARGVAATQLAAGAPSAGVAAASMDASGSAAAQRHAAAALPSDGEGPPRDGVAAASAGAEVRAAGTAEELRGAEQRLADAREEAFERVLAARREGGWAPLPEELALEVERELARRSLLLRVPDGRMGPDAASAIAWVQRSHGRAPTGDPGVGVLEILGIDPAPMFEGGEACGSINRR